MSMLNPDFSSHGEILKLINCKILKNDELIDEHLWIKNGKFINGEKLFFEEKKSADKIIDCKGLTVSPGFIDIQINGGFGVDFSNSKIADFKEGLERVSLGLLQHGVTSFCPTVITSSHAAYHCILPRLIEASHTLPGAQVIGLHLEGPFISSGKAGMHPRELIFNNESNGEVTLNHLLDTYGSLDNISIITVAPELPGCLEVIKKLSERNIAVSLGHSMATLEEGKAAILAGAKLITHLFSSMEPFHHRDPHLIGLLTQTRLEEPVYFGIIADLVHTHPAALTIACRTNPRGLILVTDANVAMQCDDGVYTFGEKTITVKDGRSYTEKSTLAGATTSLDECLRNLLVSTSITKAAALQCVTEKPARVLNIINEKGTLSEGRDADFVLLNENLEVMSTWIRGKMLHKRKDFTLTFVK